LEEDGVAGARGGLARDEEEEFAFARFVGVFGIAEARDEGVGSFELDGGEWVEVGPGFPGVEGGVVVGEGEEAPAAGACAEPAFFVGDGDEETRNGLVAWVDAVGGPGVLEGKEGVGGVGEGEGGRGWGFGGGLLGGGEGEAQKCGEEEGDGSRDRPDCVDWARRETDPNPLLRGGAFRASLVHDW
jgi:hypothetical protein